MIDQFWNHCVEALRKEIPAQQIKLWIEPLTVVEFDEDTASLSMAATIFHWGLHPWAIYAIVALALALFAAPTLHAQGRGGAPQAPATPRAAATSSCGR